MSSARLLLFLVAAALFGFAPAPFPRREHARAADDYQRLQGTWKEVGHNLGKARVLGTRWTFIRAEDGKEAMSYDLTLDPSVSPRAMEWRGAKGLRYVASYKIEGQRLTVIYAKGSFRQTGSRPTDFDANTTNRFVYEFERRE